jgi:hypothetical protein
MPVMTNQLVPQGTDRVHHISVPADPAQEVAPAIVVFHGGGQDATTIARRWGHRAGQPRPGQRGRRVGPLQEVRQRLPNP